VIWRGLTVGKWDLGFSKNVMNQGRPNSERRKSQDRRRECQMVMQTFPFLTSRFNTDLLSIDKCPSCQAETHAMPHTIASSLLFLPQSSREYPLLLDSPGVESQLLTLENVSITSSTLSRSARHDGVHTTSLKLPLKRSLNLSRLHPLGLSGLNTLALLRLLNRVSSLAGLSPAKVGTVVCLVPLPERRGIDLNNSGAGQGVGADELVVGRVEGDTDDTALAGNALGTPGEVAGVETESAELAVATTGAHEMDTLSSDTGVGGLATLLESSGEGVRL
jgi:hypothetical protein